MMVDHTKRFLVIRLSSIGDIVHALPAVAALAEAFPRAEIHCRRSGGKPCSTSPWNSGSLHGPEQS